MKNLLKFFFEKTLVDQNTGKQISLFQYDLVRYRTYRSLGVPGAFERTIISGLKEAYRKG